MFSRSTSALVPLTVLLLCILSSFTTAYSEDTPPVAASSVDIRTLPPSPEQPALDDHKLSWIHTRNDFDQSSLNEIEIDEKIKAIVTGYGKALPIAAFEIPINTKRLTYLKLQEYKEFDSRLSSWNLPNKQTQDGKVNVYQYGPFHISVPGNSPKDQLRVYSICRALEILRYRYPVAYQRLFVDVQIFPDASPSQGNFHHKRRYDKILFSFDESPLDIAAGGTAKPLGTKPEDTTNEEDLAVVSISYSSMSGATTEKGSQLLYESQPDENFALYMREGIVESLTHEMLHRYIDYRSPYEPVAFALWSERNTQTALSRSAPIPAQPVDPSAREKEHLTGEELAVALTSMRFFMREGGIQSALFFWYRGTFDVNIRTLTTRNTLNNYLNLLDPDMKFHSVLYVKRFSLPYLD